MQECAATPISYEIRPIVASKYVCHKGEEPASVVSVTVAISPNLHFVHCSQKPVLKLSCCSTSF